MVAIRDGIYYYVHPFGANADVYAFKDADSRRFDLIDTGMQLPFCLPHVIRGLARDGLDPRDLRDIYHTHAHFDHVHADAYFQRRARRRNPDVRVFCPAPDVFRFAPSFSLVDHNVREVLRYLPKGSIRAFRRTYYFGRLLARTVLRQRPVRHLTPLADGARVSIGGRSAEVITTGGHTEGHSFFKFPAEHVLVVGDNDAPNETTVDFGKMAASMVVVRDVLRGWTRSSDDDVAIFIGHNRVKRGQACVAWAQGYLDQFNRIFAALVGHAAGRETIDATWFLERLGGYVLKFPFQALRFFAFIQVFVILKFLQAREYGHMALTPARRLFFHVAPGIEDKFTRDFPLGA